MTSLANILVFIGTNRFWALNVKEGVTIRRSSVTPFHNGMTSLSAPKQPDPQLPKTLCDETSTIEDTLQLTPRLQHQGLCKGEQSCTSPQINLEYYSCNKYCDLICQEEVSVSYRCL